MISRPHRRPPSAPRPGNVFGVVLFLLAVAATAVGVGYWYYSSQQPEETAGPLLSEVKLAPFDNIVLEQGEVESGSNVEIRCEVKSRGTGGITILQVLPEGTIVAEGDVIARLDSTALEQEKIQQQITLNTSDALVVQAQNTYEAALIAKTEYLEGTFKQEERTILGEVFVAEQALRNAQLAYESAERLAAKNIITSLQLEGAQFAVDKAENELLAAQGKLEVLRKYTKEKLLKQFNSDIATSLAKLGAEKSVNDLERKKLQDVEDQVAKCTLKAPSPGQVVYVNKYNTSSRGGATAEFVVEPGATVREQQPLFRLPDGNNMQIKALVNESRITRVRAGLPVAIRVDALKDVTLQGEVTKVNQYAEPGGWSSGTIKKYATLIKIVQPPPDLRVNMNAEVRIYVERRPEALQIPVQALAEQQGKYFAVVKSGEHFETRQLKGVSTNDQTAAVGEGLAAGESVVMNPRSRPDLLKFPPLEEKPEIAVAEVKPQVATVAAAPAGESATKKGPPSPAAMVTQLFAEFDTDKDGKLSAAEQAAMPEDRRSRVSRSDTNQDGTIERAEMTAAITAAMRRRQEGEGGGP